MDEYRVGTMNVTGSDAFRLKELCFNPSCEAIRSHNAYVEELNNSIAIQKHSLGFSAEIDNLDLSFLDKDSDKHDEQLTMTVKIPIKVTKQLFVNEQSIVTKTKVKISTDKKFSTGETSNIQNWAA